MARGDKLQGQVIQHIPPFSSWGFCCNCQQECEIANPGGAGFCGVNDHGQQPGLRPKKPFHICSHESSKGKSLWLLLAWMRFKQTISMRRTHYLINSWPSWSVKWFSKMYFLVFKWASIKVLEIVYTGDAGRGLLHAYHLFFHRGGFLAYWKLSKDEIDWFGRSKEPELIPWLEHPNAADAEQYSQQCNCMSVLAEHSKSMI